MDIKTLLENGQFPIEGIIVSKDTAENELLSIGGETVSNNKDLRIILFEENKVKFLGETFFGEFIFSEKKLYEITLEPIVLGVNAPHWPDENYEKIKYDFCTSLLKRYLKLEINENNTEACYKNSGFRIVCNRNLGGHSQGCGGNIVVIFKDESK